MASLLAENKAMLLKKLIMFKALKSAENFFFFNRKKLLFNKKNFKTKKYERKQLDGQNFLKYNFVYK